MSEQNQHINPERIARFLADEMSPEERQAFEQEVRADNALQQEIKRYERIWNASNSEDQDQEVDVDLAWKAVAQKTIHRESSGTIIHLDTDQKSRSPNPRMLWIGIAATITVLFIITTVNWLTGQGPEIKTLAANTAVATINLVDGSTIDLAPNSSLTYPEEFSKAQRLVRLKGTGYFEISKDADRPFIVQTKNGNITVLGTAFEVDASNLNKLEITVNEGLVRVVNDSLELSSEVAAGEHCDLNLQEKSIQVGEIKNPAAFFWKDKTIRFKRTELKKVLQTLREELHIKAEISSPSIEGCELTATFKDESTDAIMEIIATTLGLQLTKEDDTYLLSGEGC